MGRIDRRFVRVDGFVWGLHHEELPPWQRRFLYRKLPRHKYQIRSESKPLHNRALFLAERRARMALGTPLVMTPTVRLQDGIYVVLSFYSDGHRALAPWSDAREERAGIFAPITVFKQGESVPVMAIVSRQWLQYVTKALSELVDPNGAIRRDSMRTFMEEE